MFLKVQSKGSQKYLQKIRHLAYLNIYVYKYVTKYLNSRGNWPQFCFMEIDLIILFQSIYIENFCVPVARIGDTKMKR